MSGVEAIPDMVHITVELVSVRPFVVTDVNWLHTSVISVPIKRFKQQDSNVSVFALPSIPF